MQGIGFIHLKSQSDFSVSIRLREHKVYTITFCLLKCHFLSVSLPLSIAMPVQNLEGCHIHHDHCNNHVGLAHCDAVVMWNGEIILLYSKLEVLSAE